MQSTVHVRRAVVAACLTTIVGLSACGGGNGGAVAETPAPGGPPDTPLIPPPPPPPTFVGLSDFAPAELVLGQPDFVSGDANQDGSLGGATLSEPLGIAVGADGMVFVADSANRRVLAFRQFPHHMGQDADFVLGQLGPDRVDYAAPDAFGQPVSVSVGAGKVAVADETGNRVLIYDAIPANGDARPAVVVGQPDFESSGIACDSATLSIPKAVHITPDGKLIVADYGHSRVLIWKDVAQVTNGMAADVVLGQPDFESCLENRGRPTPIRGSMNSPEAIWSDGTRLAVADTFNDRVLLWDAISMDFPVGPLPHGLLGQPDFNSATAHVPADDSMKKPRGVAFNGTHLAVSDSINNRVLLWDGWPTQIRQAATTVLGQRDMSRDLPNDGIATPARETLDGPVGVAFHQDKLLVVDRDNNRVLVYRSR